MHSTGDRYVQCELRNHSFVVSQSGPDTFVLMRDDELVLAGHDAKLVIEALDSFVQQRPYLASEETRRVARQAQKRVYTCGRQR